MFSAAYKRYGLALMTAVYAVNLIDRGLVHLLLQPIKEDLQLTDTQLGMLTGIAFALFYAVAGVPIARWADRGNRANIAALAIGLWGLTVMACVFVTSFVQMLLARVAAAIGEAGCKPPTYSMVGDYFPGAVERTRAMSVYWLGNPIAALISFGAGGILNELVGWRLTFLIMGIPGLLLALLVKLTLAETRTRDAMQRSNASLPPFGAVLRTLWRQQSSRRLSMALILFFTGGMGLSSWYAAFIIRIHGMATGELGLLLGVIFGLAGFAGVLLGGYLANGFFAGNERGQMRMCAVGVMLTVPCVAAFVFLPQKYLSLIALVPLIAMANVFIGPTYAVMQRLVPDGMRATVLAVVLLLVNLIGMGMGPQIVGILSDMLTPAMGTDALRYAMLAVSSTALWSAYYFWQVGKTVQADLALVAVPLTNDLEKALTQGNGTPA